MGSITSIFRTAIGDSVSIRLGVAAVDVVLVLVLKCLVGSRRLDTRLETM